MIRLLVCLALVGCGGGHSAPARPTPPPVTPDASPPAAEQLPDRAACDRLITHVVDLDMAARRVTTPPDRVPTANEQAQVRAQVRDQYLAGCLQMPRAAFDCALAAASLDALVACDAPGPAPAQATRNSSTSNNSVAPGGITPPAPRSP